MQLSDNVADSDGAADTAAAPAETADQEQAQTADVAAAGDVEEEIAGVGKAATDEQAREIVDVASAEATDAKQTRKTEVAATGDVEQELADAGQSATDEQANELVETASSAEATEQAVSDQVRQFAADLDTASRTNWVAWPGNETVEYFVSNNRGDRLSLTCTLGAFKARTTGRLWLSGGQSTTQSKQLKFTIAGKAHWLPLDETGRIDTSCAACADSYDFLWGAMRRGYKMTVGHEKGRTARFTLAGSGAALPETPCETDYARSNAAVEQVAEATEPEPQEQTESVAQAETAEETEETAANNDAVSSQQQPKQQVAEKPAAEQGESVAEKAATALAEEAVKKLADKPQKEVVKAAIAAPDAEVESEFVDPSVVEKAIRNSDVAAKVREARKSESKLEKQAALSSNADLELQAVKKLGSELEPKAPKKKTTLTEPEARVKRELFQRCKNEWPADFAMQEYCMTNAVRAAGRVEAMMRSNRGSKLFDVVLYKCYLEWQTDVPDSPDWAMIEYCINMQMRSAKALGY